MELTNQDVSNARGVLEALNQASLPVRSSARVARTMAQFEEELKFIQEQQRDILQEHQETSEDGELLYYSDEAALRRDKAMEEIDVDSFDDQDALNERLGEEMEEVEVEDDELPETVPESHDYANERQPVIEEENIETVNKALEEFMEEPSELDPHPLPEDELTEVAQALNTFLAEERGADVDPTSASLRPNDIRRAHFMFPIG